MKKENRVYLMYPEDILIEMNRITEYIQYYSSGEFKKIIKSRELMI